MNIVNFVESITGRKLQDWQRSLLTKAGNGECMPLSSVDGKPIMNEWVTRWNQYKKTLTQGNKP